MFSIDEILKATQGKLLQGNPQGTVKGVSIDSRAIKTNDLFIAIKGEKHDAHDFIAKVVRQGVSVLLVHRPVKVNNRKVTVIQVKDTTRALGHLARFHRLRFDIPVVGITGSAGKTTTKEMIAAVLKKKYNVLANEGTQNNHIGVPLTLFKLRRAHKVAVIEMGTNQPGDIAWLAETACPTIAVLTNIGESHLEKLKTLEGVYREKMHLAKFVSSDGYVIFNKDDIYLTDVPGERLRGRVISYAVKTKADYSAVDVRVNASLGLNFKTGKKPYFLQTFSADMAYNALAAVSCARILDVSVKDIQNAFKGFRFQRGRQEILKKHGLMIINDSYNANPVSMRSAVATLDAFPAEGKRILICADMLELGWRSKELHQKVGECVAASKVDVLMTLGDQARWILEKAHQKNRRLVAVHFNELEALKNYLSVLCGKGDVVLVKGSRRMSMENVVDFLVNKLRN